MPIKRRSRVTRKRRVVRRRRTVGVRRKRNTGRSLVMRESRVCRALGYPIAPRYKMVAQLERTFDVTCIAQPNAANFGYFDMVCNYLGVAGSSSVFSYAANPISANTMIGAGGTLSSASYSGLALAAVFPAGMAYLQDLYDSYRVYGNAVEISVMGCVQNGVNIPLQLCVVPIISPHGAVEGATTFSEACSEPRAKFMTAPEVTTGRRKIGVKQFMKTAEAFGVTSRAVQDNTQYAYIGSGYSGGAEPPTFEWGWRFLWAIPSYITLGGGAESLNMVINVKSKYYLELFQTNKVLVGS